MRSPIRNASAVLSGHVNAVLSGHVSAVLSGHVNAVLSGHVRAVLSGHVNAVLSCHVSAVLSGYASAVLSSHANAVLSDHASAVVFGHGNAVLSNISMRKPSGAPCVGRGPIMCSPMTVDQMANANEIRICWTFRRISVSTFPQTILPGVRKTHSVLIRKCLSRQGPQFHVAVY